MAYKKGESGMETIQKTRQGKRQAAQRSFGSKCGIFLALLLFLGCVCIRFYPYVEEWGCLTKKRQLLFGAKKAFGL